jgi:hypothetical protein
MNDLHYIEDDLGADDPEQDIEAEDDIEDGDEQPGYFGGLSPAEAGRRSAAKQRAERELFKGDHEEKIISALSVRASKGEPAAVRELRELGVLKRNEYRDQDQRFLALLTAQQRRCIKLVLEGEPVSEELAIEAWC